MKKLFLYILGIIGIILPISASASSLSLSVSCKDVIVGSATSCTVYASPSNGIAAASGSISVSGSAASLTGTTKGAFSGGDLTNSSFALYGDLSTSRITLFTLNFNSVSVGENTITVRVNTFTDGDFEDVDGTITATGKIVVSPKPTAAPTTTTTRTTRQSVTAPINTTQQTVPVTQENKLKLTSLKVGDFQVEEKNGVYYVTTNPDTETVEIVATAPEGVSITGQGTRTLGVGTNSVTLTLSDGSGGSAIISVLITRPEGGDSNTLLRELGVIDAKLDFNPNVKDYTITVPYDTKEIYVYATAQSLDASVKGDGKYTLDSKDTNVYVTVSFGDKANTTYKIHVVKEYKGLVPIIALGIALLIALIVMAYFINKYIKTKKELNNAVVAKKAESFRLTEDEGPQMSVNGASATGIGARIVKPQAVGVSSINNSVDEDKTDIFTPITQPEESTIETQKIVESHPTTVPGMVPPKEVVNEPTTSPQVKVVKRVVNPTTGEVRFITVTQKAENN